MFFTAAFQEDSSPSRLLRLARLHRRQHVLCHRHHVDLAVHDDVGGPVRFIDQPAQAVAIDALDDDLGKLLGGEDGLGPC